MSKAYRYGRRGLSAGMVQAAIVFALLAGSTMARAASYDCAKASTTIETTICRDPALSGLDDRMAASYRNQRSRLGPIGSGWVRASQANWLRWMRATCGSRADLSACLEDAYQQRIVQLERTVVVDVPGFRVVLINDHDRPGHGPYAELLIETVSGDADRAFNAAIASYSRTCVSDEPPSSSHVEVTWARPDMVSAILTIGCEAPTGRMLADSRGFTVRAGSGALRAADLFAGDRGWAAVLVGHCRSDLARQAALLPAGRRPDAETLSGLIEENCPHAARPERWALSPQGLMILVDRSRLWADGIEMEDVRIPWSSLEAVLAPGRP